MQLVYVSDSRRWRRRHVTRSTVNHSFTLSGPHGRGGLRRHAQHHQLATVRRHGLVGRPHHVHADHPHARCFDARPDSRLGPRSSPASPNDTFTVTGPLRERTVRHLVEAAWVRARRRRRSSTTSAISFLTIYPTTLAEAPEHVEPSSSAGGPADRPETLLTTDLSAAGRIQRLRACRQCPRVGGRGLFTTTTTTTTTALHHTPSRTHRTSEHVPALSAPWPSGPMRPRRIDQRLNCCHSTSTPAMACASSISAARTASRQNQPAQAAVTVASMVGHYLDNDNAVDTSLGAST